jgi:hypothetical protein
MDGDIDTANDCELICSKSIQDIGDSLRVGVLGREVIGAIAADYAIA